MLNFWKAVDLVVYPALYWSLVETQAARFNGQTPWWLAALMTSCRPEILRHIPISVQQAVPIGSKLWWINFFFIVQRIHLVPWCFRVRWYPGLETNKIK